MNLDPKVGTGNDVNAQEGQKEDAGGVETTGAAAPYLILEDDCEVRAVATFVFKEKVTDYLNHPKMLADTISAARNHGVIISKVMHSDGTVCAMPMVMLPTIAPEDWDKTMHEVSFDLAGCWSGVILSGLWSKDLDLSRFVLELLAVIKVENATNGTAHRICLDLDPEKHDQKGFKNCTLVGCTATAEEMKKMAAQLQRTDYKKLKWLLPGDPLDLGGGLRVAAATFREKWRDFDFGYRHIVCVIGAGNGEYALLGY